MRSSTGIFLLALSALFCTLAIEAAPQGRQQGAQDRNPNNGLPWAYGFTTSAPPEAAPGGGGRGGAAALATATPAAAAPAPAAPAAEPEDRETPRKLPGAASAFALKEVDNNYGPADWYPGDHPSMPDVVAHGRRDAMVNACGFCHYPNGKGRPNNAGPAGLPAGYVLQQIEDFKSGARTSWDKRKRNTGQMIAIAKGLSPEDMEAAANYFASMKWTPWVKVIEADTVPQDHVCGRRRWFVHAADGRQGGNGATRQSYSRDAGKP